jgi:hypothetical protein
MVRTVSLLWLHVVGRMTLQQSWGLCFFRWAGGEGPAKQAKTARLENWLQPVIRPPKLSQVHLLAIASSNIASSKRVAFGYRTMAGWPPALRLCVPPFTSFDNPGGRPYYSTCKHIYPPPRTSAHQGIRPGSPSNCSCGDSCLCVPRRYRKRDALLSTCCLNWRTGKKSVGHCVGGASAVSSVPAG